MVKSASLEIELFVQRLLYEELNYINIKQKVYQEQSVQ